MKIIVDENISFAKEAFTQFGKVELYHGREITNEILKDAEILITRSITNVDEALLQNTKIRFVGTATIGTNHIDLNYLKNTNIKFASAKGCNADAVTEYLFTALFKIYNDFNLSFNNKSIGIIGVGNIGSRIKKVSESLGLQIFPNDPPLQRSTGNPEFVSLEKALKCDIVTFHTPLNLSGTDITHHLLNENNLHLIKENAVIINASRGAVIDNSALLNFLKNRKDVKVVLDVWENEPKINTQLLSLVDLATPHIAGYTLEGKINGTKIIYEALCDFLNADKIWLPKLPNVDQNNIKITSFKNEIDFLYNLTSKIYNIENDNKLLKKSASMDIEHQINYFDHLRRNYNLRREFYNYSVPLNSGNTNIKDVLQSLRFKVTSN